MRNTVNISREPQGETYRALVTFGAGRCGSFQLVFREGAGLSSEARHLLKDLAPYERRRYQSSEWPGTQLIDHVATIVEFDLTAESVRILHAAAEGLYSWTQPALPEDLCLLRADGTPWLATIAHEGDGYFELSDEELSELLASLPQLAPYLTRQSDES